MKYLAIGLMCFLIVSISVWDGGSAATYETATNMDKIIMVLIFGIIMGIGYLAGSEEQ